MRDVELVQLRRLVLVLVLVDDDDDDDDDDNDENDDENDVESWRATLSLLSSSSRGTKDSSFSRCRCCWHDDITGTLSSSVIVNNVLGRCKGCGAILMLRYVSFGGFCFGWMLIIVFRLYERVD